MGNALRLEQLLQNLIANALKFIVDDSPQVEIGAELRDGKLRVHVRDNGIGIAEQDQARIFRVFQRVGATSDYEGSGIGLATCQKIVEQHGGDLWVESELGAGTTFFFTLPPAVNEERDALGTVLTEIEGDVLSEFLNVAAGSAAAELGETAACEVLLTTPRTSIAQHNEIEASIRPDHASRMCAIRAEIKGGLAGEAHFILPQESLPPLHRLMSQLALGPRQIQLSVEDELLKLGGRFLHSCLTVLAESFALEVSVEDLRIIKGSATHILNVERDQPMLMLQTDLSIPSYGIEIYLIISIEADKIAALQAHITKLLGLPNAE